MKPSMRLSALALVPAALLIGAAPALSDPASLDEGVGRHLQALQAIAAAHGGNRAAGTPGYDRSAEYVAVELLKAGYAVRFEEFSFPYFEERSPPLLASVTGEPAVAQGREALRTLASSGSGDVTARLQGVDLGAPDDPPKTSTSGCEREDFAGFERGRIALLRRGTCPFQAKVDHAAAAGAAAVVIMNEGTEGQAGIFGGRLSSQAAIPVVAVPTETGRRLQRAAERPEGLEARVKVDAESGRRPTRNVLAERPGRDPAAPVVVVGAHLDSVPEGPGLNDNGSGTAATLEAALRLAADPAPGRPVRFAFWGAEERGLVGSRHHVGALNDEGKKRIALYVNLDMVGSPNPGRFLRSAGEAGTSAAADIRAALARWFTERNLPVEERANGQRRIGGGSDDASFAQAGIATVMLYTGAGEQKGVAQADRFGGDPGRPYDPCYHQACDTVANIDRPVLGQMTEALLAALRTLPASPLPPPAGRGSD